MKGKRYIKINGLSVSQELYSFINNDLLPKTKINNKDFWSGFSKSVHELAPKNKKLLGIRNKIQKNIDQWHIENKGKEFNSKNYTNYLKKIGYLVKEGSNFSISTKNIDKEISKIAGPQLVVPVMNARYSLNAANARWGSLYNALYGTDVISESNGAERGKKYNYIRGEKVIEYARNILDSFVPLKKGSWKDILKIPKVENNKLNLKLKNPKQFVGYAKKSNHLSSLLFINNNLHIDVKFDPKHTLGGLKDKAAIYDIILESAITTIIGLLPMVTRVNIDFASRQITFGGPSTDWWVLLASAVAFGLAFATLLTLIVTPSMLALGIKTNNFFSKNKMYLKSRKVANIKN